MEPVLTVTDAAVVVDVTAVETTVAILVVATDATVAIEAGTLRGIAPSDADTWVFCCVAWTA